jgi:outer membrane biosynthesis protein TonB
LRLGPDEEAVKSLQTWKFEPATPEGKPVALKIAVQVGFRLS